MHHLHINFVSVLIATVAKFFLGWLWYSPLLFANKWMQLTGCNPDQMKAGLGKAIVGDLITTFFMAFVLMHSILWSGANNAGMGTAIGIISWLGFVFPVMFSSVLYEKRPFKLFAINGSFQLLGLIVMGIILAVGR